MHTSSIWQRLWETQQMLMMKSSTHVHQWRTLVLLKILGPYEVFLGLMLVEEAVVPATPHGILWKLMICTLFINK
jgi:hypothetical protein